MSNTRKKTAAPKEVETSGAVTNAPSSDHVPETPTNVPQLGLADLNALQQIAEVAVQRGAYRVEELEVVGRTISKLKNFLAHVAATPTATPEQK